MNRKLPNKNAFTMIELLVVVVTIGILTSIFLRIINARRQQEVAIDATRKLKLKETADIIETFKSAEGHYPDQGSDNNPLNGTDKDIVLSYIDDWYTGLVYIEDSDEFALYILSAVSTNYYKYSSTWNTIKECAFVSNDTTTCDGEVTTGIIN